MSLIRSWSSSRRRGLKGLESMLDCDEVHGYLLPARTGAEWRVLGSPELERAYGSLPANGRGRGRRAYQSRRLERKAALARAEGKSELSSYLESLAK